MKAHTARLLLLAIFWGWVGCSTPHGTTPESKRTYVHWMEDGVLTQLYALRPELRTHVEESAGYGVFSNFGLKILLLGTGNGYGLVHDNSTGEDTYMRMAELGAGLGLGAKDFWVVYVFRDPFTLQTFVDSGWEFGGDAEATAIFDGDQGISTGVQGMVAAGGAAEIGGTVTAGIGSTTDGGVVSQAQSIETYQLTRSGLVLQAMVSGTKFWRDGELNLAEPLAFRP